MKLIDANLPDYTGAYIKVYKNPQGITIMEFLTIGRWMDNDDDYANILLGKCSSCDDFMMHTFENFTYNSVLVAGLGLGLIPNELAEVNQCSKIDVVEINQEVIDYALLSSHLNPMINIIQGDIFTYTTTEKYDLIIIDTMWDREGMSEEQYQMLLSNLYDNNINSGGALYVPVHKKWLVK